MGMIAVFGGTFNPIHTGHIEILDCLSKIENIDEILIIPTKIPPHKNTEYLADSVDRLNMCKIIASNYNNAKVSDIELNREGKSFTIDTVNELRSIYPDKEIALTIGGDMLVSFDKWKDYENILKLCTLITFKRGNILESDYLSAINNLKLSGAKIIEIKEDITDISSTQIRNDLENNIKPQYLDQRIFDYIRENNLFGVKNEV